MVKNFVTMMSLVILSAAKNLSVQREILRCAQNDRKAAIECQHT